jgi:membrane fusion protein, multidrug efflux system
MQLLFPRWIFLLAVLPLIDGCKRKQAAAPAPPPPAVTVTTLKAESVTLTRELPGRTTPFLVAEVRPQVTGIVQRRLFTEGALVKEGEPLYQLDDATYRAEHNSAKAALARAQAALELARLNAERSAGLAKVDAVSRQENENAIAALRQAQAEVGVAEAAVAGSGVVLSYSRIVSPISGRIGKSAVTQGALVTANQPTPLATVQQLEPIYVDLTQSSRELLQLRKDVAAGTMERTEETPVTILLEDGTEFQHKGKLAFTEVSVDPTTGSFGLRVIVPNPDHILLPGMYVRAIVATGMRQDAVLVPQQGIARDPKGNTNAMILGPDEKVQVRQVVVSRTIGDKWLVESGLAAGDKVIVEGLQKVRPGGSVRVTEGSSSKSATAATNTVDYTAGSSAGKP